MQSNLAQVKTGSALAGRAGEALQEITRTAEQASEHVNQIAAVSNTMATAKDDLVKAVESVSAVVEEHTAITEEMAANSASIRADIESVVHISRKTSKAAADAETLTTEMALQMQSLNNTAQGLDMLSQQLAGYADDAIMHHRRTMEEDLIQKGSHMAREAAGKIGVIFENGVAKGILSAEAVFDTDYQPIPNTKPQKFHTAYDNFTDKNILSLEDSYLTDSDVVFVVAVDVNGYLPTHNTRFSKPVTGNYQTDLVGNRTKRMFDDPVGLVAGRNHAEKLLRQIYWRDTGEVMWDISAPIWVNGRHWGGLRVGLSMQRVTDGTFDSLRKINIKNLVSARLSALTLSGNGK